MHTETHTAQPRYDASAGFCDLTDRAVREPECARITGLSRAYRFELEKLGEFPMRRRLSARSHYWLLSELMAWLYNPNAFQKANQSVKAD